MEDYGSLANHVSDLRGVLKVLEKLLQRQMSEKTWPVLFLNRWTKLKRLCNTIFPITHIYLFVFIETCGKGMWADL